MSNPFPKHVDSNGLTKETREQVGRSANGWSVGGKNTGSTHQTGRRLSESQK